MTPVWLAIAGLALLVAGGFVVGALRRSQDVSPDEAEAVFADRRREVRSEGQAQGLQSGEIDALEEELALDFVAGTKAETPVSASLLDPRRGRLGALAPKTSRLVLTAAAIALLAAGLYALWGEPNAAVLAAAPQLLAQDADADHGSLAELQAALAARAARRSGDADTLFYLGSVRMRLQDYDGAAEAFAALQELIGGNEQVDGALAQASYLAAGGRVTSAVRQTMERVLASRPDHPDMLEMLAVDALRRADFRGAARYLARALRQPLSESRAAILEATLAAARSRLDAQRPNIEVAVSVDEVTAPWLMVFARPLGGGMPLAVTRRRAKTMQTVVLDDADSMIETAPLSAGGLVEVVARLSATGDATSTGAEAVSEPVDSTSAPRIALTLKGRPDEVSDALPIERALP